MRGTGRSTRTGQPIVARSAPSTPAWCHHQCNQPGAARWRQSGVIPGIAERSQRGRAGSRTLGFRGTHAGPRQARAGAERRRRLESPQGSGRSSCPYRCPPSPRTARGQVRGRACCVCRIGFGVRATPMNTASRAGSRIVRPCSSGPTSSTATSIPVACSIVATRSPSGCTPRWCPWRNRAAAAHPSVSAFKVFYPRVRSWREWPGRSGSRPVPGSAAAPRACGPCPSR